MPSIFQVFCEVAQPASYRVDFYHCHIPLCRVIGGSTFLSTICCRIEIGWSNFTLYSGVHLLNFASLGFGFFSWVFAVEQKLGWVFSLLSWDPIIFIFLFGLQQPAKFKTLPSRCTENHAKRVNFSTQLAWQTYLQVWLYSPLRFRITFI